jgi:hypothetical protein
MAKRDINNPAQPGERDSNIKDPNEGVGSGPDDLRGIADEEGDDFEDSDDSEDLEDEDEGEV